MDPKGVSGRSSSGEYNEDILHKILKFFQNILKYYTYKELFSSPRFWQYWCFLVLSRITPAFTSIIESFSSMALYFKVLFLNLFQNSQLLASETCSLPNRFTLTGMGHGDLGLSLCRGNCVIPILEDLCKGAQCAGVNRRQRTSSTTSLLSSLLGQHQPG